MTSFRKILYSVLFILCTVSGGLQSAFAMGVYEGERNSFNRFHGKGAYTYGNGNVYKGDWVDGRKHGIGVQTDANGERYEGEWKDNREDGQGKYTWPNGDSYEGKWAAGKRHGNGVFVGADGSRYEGEWFKNKRQGYGVAKAADNTRYEGNWEKDHWAGAGIYTNRAGDRIEATWVGKTSTEDATVTFANGDKYIGPLENLKPHGNGVCKVGTKTAACRFNLGKRMGVTNANAASAENTSAEAASAKAASAKAASAKAALTKVEPEKVAAPKNTTTKVASTKTEPKTAEPVKKAQPKPAEVKPVPVKPVAAKPVPAKATPPTVKASEQKKQPAPAVKAAADVSAISNVAPTNVSNSTVAAVPVADTHQQETPVVEKSKPKSPAKIHADGTLFYFIHDWGPVGPSDADHIEPAQKDVKRVGDLIIKAEGEMNVTLVIDEYFGPGTYELGYFKASVSKPGIASFHTTTSKPGQIEIIRDDGKQITGRFEFVGYRNGSTSTGEKRTIQSGQFNVNLK